MSETQVNPEPAKTAGWYIKNGILLVLIIVLIGFIVVMFGEWQERNEYNRIVNSLMNEQQFEAAVAAFEDLRPSVDEELQAQIDQDMAFCYIQLAQDPSKPLSESKAYLQKAADLDDSLLTPADRRILSMESKRSSPPTAPAPAPAAPAPAAPAPAAPAPEVASPSDATSENAEPENTAPEVSEPAAE